MAKQKRIKTKPGTDRDGEAARIPANAKLAFTIREFCELHNIAVSFFYELQKRGLAPRVMELGARRLVSVEEAKRWRERVTERETQSAVGTQNAAEMQPTA
jgi:predicted DNA-binding transcriptional regulator AlpA